MSGTPPPVRPRNASGIRVMPHNRHRHSHDLPENVKVNGSSSVPKPTSSVNAEREVEILNHCFDDIERFMGRLQQTAEAQSILNQNGTRKKSRKSKKKKEQDDDLLALKASCPADEEFVDIFQKIKYSFSLLDRLKSSITDPSSEELLHHIFIPLDLMVKTTGGPEMGGIVISPALTSGAVSLLQKHLTDKEKELWTSLGPYWTLHRSQLDESVPPYTPVFLDGWKPDHFDLGGQLWGDPVESQHKQDALPNTAAKPLDQTNEGHPRDGSELPPEGERMFTCSYDFVARNSSELSVLQGETLEVIESSKRWWKCRNRFDQIGFVPFNILEPLAGGGDESDSSKKEPLAPLKQFSYSFSGPEGPNPTAVPRRHPSMNMEVRDQGFMANNELLQRLANGRPASVRPLVIPRTTDTLAPLDFHSPPAEVEDWLRGKGFTESTVTLLGRLSGAELFALNKADLRMFSPEEGARVYSQMMVQKALLEDVHKATELETMMEKQKQKVDSELESGTL
ncbi:epidermal growth factor receptor kinase substrate 8-like protein 1a isoform X2 [Esox lucius]|uniref:epidermal growth factor receptor kinase substrate 8-like protein 1a isoform X2 n=1 Tax=Esox lucius TaxID=8010 RepID=UPI0014776378|nr:epidermal growth factor receptor kinase substrate 8-like protein 1a isoform X2 [Esox lucius]